MTLADLALDTAFLQPATGITGVLLHKSQGAATVQLRRERTTWSLGTVVEPLPEQPELPL